jgi:hypothetical protein
MLLYQKNNFAYYRPVLIIAIMLLVAHAPLGLNDGLVMDDWLALRPRPDYAVHIDFLLHGAGHPIFYGFYSLANLTAAPILFMQVVALAAIICGSVGLWLTATRTNLMSKSEAAGFSLIVWTYPGYQVWAGKGNTGYVLCFALSFVGAWLVTHVWRTKGLTHVVLRIATAVVFFLSFALNSTMVLYAFAMLGLFVAVWRHDEQRTGLVRRTFASAWRCVTTYPELVVLPLLYWGALNVFFKRVGVYADYYDAHIPTLRELIDGWKVFFLSGYIDLLWNTARALLQSRTPFFLAAILVAAGFLPLYAGSKQNDEFRYSWALPLLLCPVLFLALSLPYLIAGVRPTGNFYESRHLLMFGVPLALGVVAVKRLTEIALGARAAFVTIFGAASILSIAMLWNGYIFMQARALKLESLVDHLASMPRPPATVFNVVDGFTDYPSPYSPAGATEITGMLQLAWGNLPFFGFTLRAERPTVLQEMEVLRNAKGSAFRNVDPTGPQATISFQPGPAAAPNAVLVRHYYACRLLVRCDVSQFLMELSTVKIDVGPIAGVEPIAKSEH